MPVEQINALGHSVHYRYDAALRLVELINGNGESYRFSYTPEGLLASETTYEGKVTEYRYDRAGQLIAYECCGIEILLERDRMGRLILKTTPDGLTRYQYDALGRLTAVTAPHAENGFVYDAIGQLLEEHSAYFISEPCPEAYKLRRVPDHYFVMRYGYDELGNRIQTVLPDGHRIDVLRYGSGHWHGVLWDGEPVVDVERDRLHRERGRQIGPKSMNLVATRSYDAMSRISTMVLKRETRDPAVLPLRERKFVYDAVGNLLSIKHGWHTLNDTLGDFHYEYDSVGQLTRAKLPASTEIYKYSAAGTIYLTPTKTQSSAPLVSLHFDKNNWLVKYERLTSRIKVDANYYYDALGRRIHKKVVYSSEDRSAASIPTKENIVFIWDGDVLQQKMSGDSFQTYLTEPDTFVPIAQVSTLHTSIPLSNKVQTVEYINCDHNGTPTEMLNDCAEVKWDGRFTTWGKSTCQSSTDGIQPFRFQGQYHDVESGFHSSRYRYYVPDAATFLTDDPLGMLGGYNLRAYPTPTRYIDPLGLSQSKTGGNCRPQCCAIAIGETQSRVDRYWRKMKKAAADDGYNLWVIWNFPGFTWSDKANFPGGPKTEEQWRLSLIENTRFINNAMSQNCKIVDIGRDPAKVRRGDPISRYYDLERNLTKGYKNLVPVKPSFVAKILGE